MFVSWFQRLLPRVYRIERWSSRLKCLARRHLVQNVRRCEMTRTFIEKMETPKSGGFGERGGLHKMPQTDGAELTLEEISIAEFRGYMNCLSSVASVNTPDEIATPCLRCDSVQVGSTFNIGWICPNCQSIEKRTAGEEPAPQNPQLTLFPPRT